MKGTVMCPVWPHQDLVDSIVGRDTVEALFFKPMNHSEALGTHEILYSN